MGFIDWHGTKEDRYDEVVEYTKILQDEEAKRRDEAVKKKWIAEELREPNASAIDISSALKLMIKSYRDATDCFVRVLNEKPEEQDKKYLWEDLWLYTAADHLAETMIPADKQEKVLQTLVEKVYRFTGGISAAEYYRLSKEHVRYRRYIRNCFELSDNTGKEFWRWIGTIGNKQATNVIRLVGQYERFITIFPYYLYLSIHPADGWQNKVKFEKRQLQGIRKTCETGGFRDYNKVRIRNPLEEADTGEDGLFRFKRVIQFRFSNIRRIQDDEEMVEELYLKLKDGGYDQTRIDSILPEDIVSQIRGGILPVFGSMEISGLGMGEKVHFMNHAVMYKAKTDGDNVDFQTGKGTIYFTDQKVMFRGNGTMDMLYDSLEKVLNYGSMPSVLAFQSGERDVFFDLPDTELAYNALQLIVNPKKTEETESRDVPFTYEELVEKADLKACIFAFEYISANEMPAVLKEKVFELLTKLKGLDKTLEKYPEKKDEISRFLSYYIPETIRVVFSYQQYLSAELDQETLMTVHRKVLDSVETMNAAVEKKTTDIYHLATMRTVSQADALTEILGQDGYSKEQGILKH